MCQHEMSTFEDYSVLMQRALHQQSASVKMQIEALTSLKETTAELTKQADAMEARLSQIQRTLESVRYASSAKIMDQVWLFLEARQSDMQETLELISKPDISLARFRETELRMMFRNRYQTRLQPANNRLSVALRNTFTRASQSFLVGLPQYSRDVFWASVWIESWDRIKDITPPLQGFVNSHITRPIVFQFLGQQGVELWREVFRDESVYYLSSGPPGKSELVPEIFGSAHSIDHGRLEGPDIYESAMEFVASDVEGLEASLFAVSAGPSAPVLVAELHERGYRALDIGNLTASYRNVFEGGRTP